MVTLKDILKSITQSIKQVTLKQIASTDQEENNNENTTTTFNLIEQYKKEGQKTLDLIEKYMDEHPYLTKNNNNTNSNTNTNTNNSSNNNNNNNNNNNSSNNNNTNNITNDNSSLNTKNNNNNNNNNPIIQITTPNIPSNVTNTVATALVNTLSLTNPSSTSPQQSTPTSSSSTTTNVNNTTTNSTTSTSIPSTPLTGGGGGGSGSQSIKSLIEEDTETSQIIDKFNVDLYNLYHSIILLSSSSSPSSQQGSSGGGNGSTMKINTTISCSPEAEKLHQQQFLFLYYYHALLPILGPQRFFTTFWYTKVIQPILSTSSYIEPIKKMARDIVSTSLCLEQQLLRRHYHHHHHQKNNTHGMYAQQIIQAYLEWIHLREKRLEEKNNNNNTMMVDDIRLQHQVLLDMEQEEWSCNLRSILMTLGAQETKTFFYLLNDYFQSSQHRLQIVYLFSEFMLRKRTHAHEILETPLFDSMLKSLMYDNSTTLIAISVTNMIMLLPRICTYLQPYLPKLFYIFARAISWDQLRDLRKRRKYNKGNMDDKKKEEEEDGQDQEDPTTTTTTTTSVGIIDLPDGTTWDCADFTFSKLAAPPSNPQTGPFFTALYGLYPCQFIHFLHKPYYYFEKVSFQVPEEFDEDMFRNRVINHHVSRHMLHPNLVTMDLDQEVVDRSRWMKMEPPDVIARIMSLDLTNAASRVAFYHTTHEEEEDKEEEEGEKGILKSSMDLLDTTLWKTSPSSTTDHYEKEKEDKEKEKEKKDKVEKKKEPTLLKKKVQHDGSNQSMINHILQLNRALKSGTEVLIGDDIWEAHLEKITSPSTTVPTTISSPSTTSTDALLTASMPISFRKEKENNADHDMDNDILGKNQLLLLSSSPIDSKDPQNNETRLLIAALKREVLLLRNELNFELFLKQQHLQHIARLHREHIMDSTVEAERQQLYNTNRMLKAQLEKTTLLLDQMKSETVLTKQKHIKWEDEQSNKLRGYREARKEWQAHMEKNKLIMEDYQQQLKDQQVQLSQYQAKISSLEMELQTLQPLIDKSNHFEQKVKQLTQQMLLWEEDTSHVQEQKKYIKGLLSQWWSMEELVASLQHENQQLTITLSQKENQISHLTKQLNDVVSSSSSSSSSSSLLQHTTTDASPSLSSLPKMKTSSSTTTTTTSSIDHDHQHHSHPFFIKDTSTISELGDMKRVIQELREKLTQSEMEKMKYQAELEIYKSQHQSSSTLKTEIEDENENE